jgi:hypothetical protein
LPHTHKNTYTQTDIYIDRYIAKIGVDENKGKENLASSGVSCKAKQIPSADRPQMSANTLYQKSQSIVLTFKSVN